MVLHHYGILGDDDGYDEDDDEGGSKGIPSRTFVGNKAAFGQKYPWALEPLKLLWGLIYIQEYAYRNVLSNAKIQIMALDLPHVEYAKKDGKKYSKKDMDECIAANAEIEKRFKEKMKQKGIDESQMERISLSDLMNNNTNK